MPAPSTVRFHFCSHTWKSHTPGISCSKQARVAPPFRLGEPEEGAPSSPSELLSWHSTIGSRDWNDDCGSPVPCSLSWAQWDVPSLCWLWGTLCCLGRSWHWRGLEELWPTQPCFAGWAMVERDMAVQGARQSPGWQDPILLGKSLRSCSARHLGARLWLGVAQIPEQGPQERSSSLHPNRHECWGLRAWPGFAPQLSLFFGASEFPFACVKRRGFALLLQTEMAPGREKPQ